MATAGIGQGLDGHQLHMERRVNRALADSGLSSSVWVQLGHHRFSQNGTSSSASVLLSDDGGPSIRFLGASISRGPLGEGK